jgi:hypothetical protein
MKRGEITSEKTNEKFFRVKNVIKRRLVSIYTDKTVKNAKSQFFLLCLIISWRTIFVNSSPELAQAESTPA